MTDEDAKKAREDLARRFEEAMAAAGGPSAVPMGRFEPAPPVTIELDLPQPASPSVQLASVLQQAVHRFRHGEKISAASLRAALAFFRTWAEDELAAVSLEEQKERQANTNR